MKITRDRARNRVYIAGVDSAVASALHLRHDGPRYWIGIADYPGEERVKAVAENIAAQQKCAAEYAALKIGTIPSNYRQRHGALLRGTAQIDDWSDEIRPIAEGLLRRAAWEQIGQLTERSHGGLIDGHVQDRWTLYRMQFVDGRLAFCEIAYRGFGDDQRETYWLPEDVFLAVCIAEIRVRKITASQAREWLDRYRGCVDTELYEVAATLAPAPLTLR